MLKRERLPRWQERWRRRASAEDHPVVLRHLIDDEDCGYRGATGSGEHGAHATRAKAAGEVSRPGMPA